MSSNTENARKPVIGLTGQIGAGKTLVASILADMGCAVIDADVLAREVLNEPEGVEFVRKSFGDKCIDAEGKIDRKAVADVVFSDIEKKNQIESYIYPLLQERRIALTERHEADSSIKAIVVESPLLIETGLKRLCDLVIIVLADSEIRLKRVGIGRSWSRQELLRREKFFLPIHLKCSIADVIVYNNSTIEDCRERVENIFSRVIFSDT